MNKKILILTLFLANIVWATPNTPPEPQGTKFFNEDLISSDITKGEIKGTGKDINTSKFFGEDTLPTKDIDTGLLIKRNLGKSEGDMVSDESGNKHLLKKGETEIREDTLAGHQTEEEKAKKEENVSKWKSDYEKFINTTDREEKVKAEYDMRAKSTDETHRQNLTVQGLADFTLKGQDPVSSSQGVVSGFQRMSFDNNDTPTFIRESDKNASKLYREMYGYEANKADTGVLLKQNAGALSQAYTIVPKLQEALTDRLKNPIIHCQISRELIPAWYCPIKGMDGFRFPGNLPASLQKKANETFTYTDTEGNEVTKPANPDLASIIEKPASLRRTNLNAAQQACNQYCWTPPQKGSCISKKMIDKKEIMIQDNNITVYPNYNPKDALFFIETDPTIPVKYVKFQVNLVTEDADISEEEWKTFLSNGGYKMRYSVLELPEEGSGLAPITIVDRAILHLRDTFYEISVPIQKSSKNFQIKFWMPYVNANILYRHQNITALQNFEKKKGKILVGGVKSEYMSDSFYYCPARQMVSFPVECGSAGYKKISYGSGVDSNHMYLCLTPEHKIGPETETGAFYDEESCEASCIEHENCLVTYQHYNGNYGTEEFMYKAEVDCVDTPENKDCTKEKCENLFKDHDIRPVNEIVVQNDNTQVYTIKQKALTGKMRPKIDIEAELSSSTDYEEMFNREQKDAAYKYMVEHLTMNPIKYPIGTEAPHSLAYVKRTAPSDFDGDAFSVRLKPRTYDYGKRFFIYAVARLDQGFFPKWGAYYVKPFGGDTYVTVKPSSGLQFKDYTYMVKLPEEATNNKVGSQNWEVFRKEEYAEVWSYTYKNKILPDGKVEKVRTAGWKVQPGGLIPPYFAKYDLASDSFKQRSKDQLAPAFKEQTFDPTDNFYEFVLTRNTNWDLFDTYGSLIRQQDPLDNESKMAKVYTPAREIIPDERGLPTNYTFYLIYSPDKLSYHQLMVAIEGENYENNSGKVKPHDNQWGVYSLMSPALFRSEKVNHDGAINNNIEPFIMSTPKGTYVMVDQDPSLSEKGKKMFRFIFLDTNDVSGTDPFKKLEGKKPDKIIDEPHRPVAPENSKLIDELPKK